MFGRQLEIGNIMFKMYFWYVDFPIAMQDDSFDHLRQDNFDVIVVVVSKFQKKLIYTHVMSLTIDFNFRKSCFV